MNTCNNWKKKHQFMFIYDMNLLKYENNIHFVHVQIYDNKKMKIKNRK